MSTSATVTLTLKSKPKIQAIQTPPRSPGTAVKLKLTKAPPPQSPGLPAPVQPSSSATPSSGAERKSPPKNGTTTPKLARKLSVSRKPEPPAQKPEPVPPKKVFSRFSLKRNSVDKTMTTAKQIEAEQKPDPPVDPLAEPPKETSAPKTASNAVAVNGALTNGHSANDATGNSGTDRGEEKADVKKADHNVASTHIVPEASLPKEKNRNEAFSQSSEAGPVADKSNPGLIPESGISTKKKVIKRTLVNKKPPEIDGTSNGVLAAPKEIAQSPSTEPIGIAPPESIEPEKESGSDSVPNQESNHVGKRAEGEVDDARIESTSDQAEPRNHVSDSTATDDAEETSTASTLTPVPSDDFSSTQDLLPKPERVTTADVNNTDTNQPLAIGSPPQPVQSLLPELKHQTDVIGKPPKPASEKREDTSSTSKTSNTSGKPLQKPLNLAQKILEAALQVSPDQISLFLPSPKAPQPPLAATSSSSAHGSTCSLVEMAHPFAPTNSQPPSRPSSVMANIQTVDIRNLGQLLRSPTPRPLSVLDAERPDEGDNKEGDLVESSCFRGSLFPYPDNASSSGVSCSLSTNSLATTLAQSRSVSPESLISLSVCQSNVSSRHNSKKENFRSESSEIRGDQQAVDALERRQTRLENDLREAHTSLSRERANLVKLQEELNQARYERNDAQQRLDSVIAESVRKEKLVQKLQRELHSTTDHENSTEVEVGMLKREQARLETQVSSQQEDIQDLQSQLQLLRGQNKQMQEEMTKQSEQYKSELKSRERELEQIKSAAHNEVAHYQNMLKETQEQRRELLRKNSELQDNRSELIQQVREVGDQAGNEKRLKRCLYRTLVLLRDARVTIEHMRATQPSRTHLSKLRQKAEEADQLKEIAERTKESAIAQSEQLEQALEQMAQTRNFLQTRAEKLASDNKQLQGQLDDLVVEHSELEDRYKKQISVNCNEQEAREEQANKIVKLEAQVETLESRIQQMRFERQVEDDCKVNSVLNTFETRTNQLELKLETEKLDKHKLQTQFNRLSDQLENMRRELDSAQKREASLQITTTNQQRCLLDMRRELADTRDRNCQMRMERQTLDSQLEELLEEVRHLQTCLRVANQRIRDLEIALETTDPIQIENIMESIIEDSASDDYEDADESTQAK
ncbi:MAR-binding filament-like protein 1 [Galendromus occidentalis]|uniref:MAR-binding filament-like protein 1 n=1 Tax=Galendromus occidentalis TaxID=34638 RepID=A0AAJ7WJE8_9ACAR|nr:MAR-binding filament-like protein 1 [Galendromus occidentalis]